MKFYLIEPKNQSNVLYTYSLLKRLIKLNNHILTEDIKDCDFVLVSLCDIIELEKLRKIKKSVGDKKIIAGGSVCILFKLISVYADYVNVGQGFEFFKCRTENEIKKLKSIYYNGCEKIIEPSTLIEWDKLHICQISKNNFSYLMSVGCKNKCKFCFTTWTNKLQKNNKSEIIVNNIVKKINGKNSIMFISNETDEYNIKNKIRDIMLINYIKKSFNKENKPMWFRIGFEFCREENRKKYGKFFTDLQFQTVLQKSKIENININFFCLGGMETKQEWYDFFDKNINIIDGDFRPKILFKFTNLDYFMFTPLHKERFNINKNNLLDEDFRNYIYNNFLIRNHRFRTQTIKYPAHCLWRTGLSYCVNEKEVNLYFENKDNKNVKEMYNLLYESNVIYNDYSNEIKFWYQ